LRDLYRKLKDEIETLDKFNEIEILVWLFKFNYWYNNSNKNSVMIENYSD